MGKQPVEEKENSEFKPRVFGLKIDLVSKPILVRIVR